MGTTPVSTHTHRVAVTETDADQEPDNINWQSSKALQYNKHIETKGSGK